MTKELTPLEALNDLREVKGWNDDEFNKRLDIIETALKEYEGAKSHIKALNKERIENSIKLKALGIIKERQVDVGLLLDCETEPEYLNRCCNRYWHNERCGWKRMTQEEFDLLKEVLE
jgi:hypothetical protein